MPLGQEHDADGAGPGQPLADTGHGADRVTAIAVQPAIDQPLQPDPGRVEPDRHDDAGHHRAAQADLAAHQHVQQRDKAHIGPGGARGQDAPYTSARETTSRMSSS